MGEGRAYRRRSRKERREQAQREFLTLLALRATGVRGELLRAMRGRLVEPCEHDLRRLSCGICAHPTRWERISMGAV